MAQLVYDLRVRFCELYVDKHSRTRDQMVQNINEGGFSERLYRARTAGRAAQPVSNRTTPPQR